MLFLVGHFSKGCTNPKLDGDDGNAEFQSPATYETAKESFAEPPQVMGAWGAADLAITDPIGTWASNVTVPDGGGGW